MSVDGDEYQYVECCEVQAFEPHKCVECDGYVCKAHSEPAWPDDEDGDRVCSESCADEWNSRQAERQWYATHDMGGSEGQS